MQANQAIRNFLNDDRSQRGHRVIEYALVIAFVALGSSAISLKAHGGAAGLWHASNTRIAAGAVTGGE